jgi:DNA-binding transcriptional MocR family regulator
LPWLFLSSFGRPGCVISNGSFSKLLGPGFRLGWLEVPKWAKDRFRSRCGVLRSGGSMNNVSAACVTHAMTSGDLQNHVGNLRKLYDARSKSVVTQLDSGLPEGFSVKPPAGGYFIWVAGPHDFSASLFSRYLEEKKKISIFPGEAFYVKEENDHDGNSCFRLSVAYYNEAVLTESVATLCQELKTFLQNS